MSIRHYNPRRRRRGGISPKARNLLFFFLGLTIALQISYPLIDGEPLRLVTIATIYAGALAMMAQTQQDSVGLMLLGNGVAPFAANYIYDVTSSYSSVLWAQLPACLIAALLFMMLGSYPDEEAAT